jgi:membrane protein implicated in regulation of membrane protease activity
MMFFLFAAGVFWYDNLPFVNLLWALLVFVGVLAIQVWEQTAFLKSVEKPHK